MAALLLAGMLVLCVLAYLAITVPAQWFPSASTVTWSAPELAVTRGRGAMEGRVLTAAPADPTNLVVVSLNTSLRSGNYPVIAWNALDVPDGAEVRLLWRNEYKPATMNSTALTVASGRILPISVANDPNWIGNVVGIALAVRGSFQQPMRVAGVAARPMGAPEIVRDRLREWFAFERWSGTSINTVIGGADTQDLPLPALLSVAIALAALAWCALASRRGWLAGAPVVIGAMFLGAWLVSDIRWTWNLARQARVTMAQFGGKTSQAKRLAGEDGALYAFIEHVRAKLPAAPARVFMVAESHYFRGRGAYHLYPHNVYFDPFMNTIPPPERMHAGDYVVVYQRRGVQFDRGEGRLRWDGNAPVKAELLLTEPGAALFQLL